MKTVFAVLSLLFSVNALSWTEQDIELARSLETEFDIPSGILLATCEAESSKNPLAVSHKNAIGLCQLLESTVRSLCTECAKPVGGTYLAVGSSGPLVAKLRVALGLPVSSSFDSDLRHALVLYQTKNGLLVDGIAGPQVWRSLFNESLPAGETLLDRMRKPEYSMRYSAMYFAYMQNRLNTKDVTLLTLAYLGGENYHPIREHLPHIQKVLALRDKYAVSSTQEPEQLSVNFGPRAAGSLGFILAMSIIQLWPRNKSPVRQKRSKLALSKL